MDGGDGGSGFTCNICFESADKDPIVTPCGHLYCKSCIYTWLRNPRHDSKRCPCPVCNANIQENRLIPLYGIGKSQDLHQNSRSVPVDSVESLERQAGQKSATPPAPNRPTPSALEWPSDPRPTPSAPEWPTDPSPATPSAPNCPTDHTLATSSTANVILNQVCRLLIRVGQYMLVRIIEVATDKLIEAVETKLNELNEAVEERNNVNGEGSGNDTGSSDEVEVMDSNGEGSHLGPWVVLDQT
ncbi:PREDICTED: E3 ubiquitin-protein ligase RMA3-like isoform 2 [Fragaria vesca subsp. vesca]|uniref:tripartite motif-containing protein 47-like n=1 Tax=Fragaria vesca subsp. vesca TaxID=101020 RepID=UPI0002C33D84|nr:PREDICTED: tripartite motif-containing protein 47-like [Fragaria vesca subsp. vesca]